MKKKHFVLFLIFLFSHLFVFGQASLSELLTVSTIDTLESYGKPSIFGYKSLHIRNNGNKLYLAAKKMWKDIDKDTSTIVFGTRKNGIWSINDIYTPNYRILDYISNLQLEVNENEGPFIFFKDRTFENGWPKNSHIDLLNLQNNNWLFNRTLSYYNDPTRLENFISFHSSSLGYIFMESFWNDPSQRFYTTYQCYDSNSDTFQNIVSYNLDSLTSNYWSFTAPTTTADGKYMAHSCIIPTENQMFMVGLFIYKRSSDNEWVQDFAYFSDTLYVAYPYLYTYNAVIGEAPNGDILLLAANSVERPMFIKSNGKWQKILDNYPTYMGTTDPGASGRPLNNERILFSSDGTAFWGDIDGCPLFPYSAETSFKTPDGYWGTITCPPPPGHNDGEGSFCHHDFTITPEDSLLIVYEYGPFDPDSVIYLVEAKAYIPDIIKKITAISEPSSNSAPNSFTLYQNYPNPFNPKTTIRFNIEKSAHVTLKVFDIAGKEVATLVNKRKSPGQYRLVFNADNLASGVYIYQLSNGQSTLSKKMIIMK